MQDLKVVAWRLLCTVIMMMHALRNVGRTVDVCSIRIEIATARRMKIAILGRHVRAYSAFKKMVVRVGERSLMGAFRAQEILTVGSTTGVCSGAAAMATAITKMGRHVMTETPRHLGSAMGSAMTHVPTSASTITRRVRSS